MVSIHTGTKGDSVVNRYCEGLSHNGAQLLDKYEKPGRNLSGDILIPQMAHLENTLDTHRAARIGHNERSCPHRNWYVSMKELIPKVAKLGYCTQRTMTRVTCSLGNTWVPLQLQKTHRRDHYGITWWKRVLLLKPSRNKRLWASSHNLVIIPGLQILPLKQLLASLARPAEAGPTSLLRVYSTYIYDYRGQNHVFSAENPSPVSKPSLMEW